MNDVEKLLDLKKAKFELMKAIQNNMNIEEKYIQYKAIYKQITDKDPNNTLESLTKLSDELER